MSQKQGNFVYGYSISHVKYIQFRQTAGSRPDTKELVIPDAQRTLIIILLKYNITSWIFHNRHISVLKKLVFTFYIAK